MAVDAAGGNPAGWWLRGLDFVLGKGQGRPDVEYTAIIRAIDDPAVLTDIRSEVEARKPSPGALPGVVRLNEVAKANQLRAIDARIAELVVSQVPAPAPSVTPGGVYSDPLPTYPPSVDVGGPYAGRDAILRSIERMIFGAKPAPRPAPKRRAPRRRRPPPKRAPPRRRVPPKIPPPRIPPPRIPDIPKPKPPLKVPRLPGWLEIVRKALEAADKGMREAQRRAAERYPPLPKGPPARPPRPPGMPEPTRAPGRPPAQLPDRLPQAQPAALPLPAPRPAPAPAPAPRPVPRVEPVFQPGTITVPQPAPLPAARPALWPALLLALPVAARALRAAPSRKSAGGLPENAGGLPANFQLGAIQPAASLGPQRQRCRCRKPRQRKRKKCYQGIYRESATGVKFTRWDPIDCKTQKRGPRSAEYKREQRKRAKARRKA